MSVFVAATGHLRFKFQEHSRSSAVLIMWKVYFSDVNWCHLFRHWKHLGGCCWMPHESPEENYYISSCSFMPNFRLIIVKAELKLLFSKCLYSYRHKRLTLLQFVKDHLILFWEAVSSEIEKALKDITLDLRKAQNLLLWDQVPSSAVTPAVLFLWIYFCMIYVLFIRNMVKLSDWLPEMQC